MPSKGEDDTHTQETKKLGSAKPLTKFYGGNCYGSLGKRKRRCYKCSGCLADDCGTCKYCLNKTKFGGNGTLKQCCSKRKCTEVHLSTSKSKGVGYYFRALIVMVSCRQWEFY